MNRQILSRLLVIPTLLLTLFIGQSVQAQERLSAPKLLPYNTVAYFRIADMPQFKDKLGETSIGKISRNEQVQSITSQLYDEFLAAYPEIEEQLGMPLDELLDLPQGEVAVALATTDTGTLMFMVLVDVGENMATAEKAIDRIDEIALQNGSTVATEMVAETEVKVYGSVSGDDGELFIKDSTVIVTNSRLLTEHLIAVWDGTALPEQRTLSQNRKFTSIMRESVGADEARPHLSWYFDPVMLVKATTQGNFQAQAVLAFLPTLGLDGFQAVGGSIILAPDGFDSISHFHVALATPRRGVLDLLTFGSGEGTPESFIPDDVSAYMTLYWNVDEAYDNLEVLVDSIIGEGGFDTRVAEGFKEAVGADLREDIIASLGGRFTLATWMEPPARINSQAVLLGVQLNDATAITDVLARVMELAEPIQQASHNNVSYYRVETGGTTRPDIPQDNPGSVFREFLRTPTPCFGIVGDYLLASDSEAFFQHAIDTHVRGSDLLADSDDYKLIALHIKDQVKDQKASAIFFSQPQESFKLLYDLIADDKTKTLLSDNSEQNTVLGILNRVMGDNELPDITDLTRHLAPAGGAMIDTDAGIHLMSFSLKGEE
jgi:hypothetical protein